MGGREEKKINFFRTILVQGLPGLTLALTFWDCSKMMREEELKPSWCSLFHLIPCLCSGSALDFVSAAAVEISLHPNCLDECPLLAEAGQLDTGVLSCCFSCFLSLRKTSII